MKKIITIEKDTRINKEVILEAGDKIKVISEGINDKNILKAVFLAGGPGSGKSFIASQMFGTNGISPLGAKVINSDFFFELGLKKGNLPSRIAPDGTDIYNQQMKARSQAKAKTYIKKSNHIESLLPLIIDGTGKDYDKVTKQASQLEDEGYDVSMVFVNTSLEVALERNEKRARTVQPTLVEEMWREVQKNIGKFNNFFTTNNRQFFVVDNNDYLEPGSPESKRFLDSLWKAGARMFNRPLRNPKGLAIIQYLRDTGGKYRSDYYEGLGYKEDTRALSESNDSLYTVYAEEDDLTFLMKDISISGSLASTEVVGFLFGECKVNDFRDPSLRAEFEL